MTGRKTKAPSTKDRIRKLETELENVSKALQLANMMIKHLTNKDQAIEADINSCMGMLNDFQYRTLSMIELSDVTKEQLEEKAKELKLADFYDASKKEDEEKGYIQDDGGKVNENSVVILTSEVEENPEAGILRSKFHMEKCLTPNIREALMDKKIGDKVEIELNGDTHVIEILELKKLEDTPETEETEKSTEE
jgi:hypothetical protein